MERLRLACERLSKLRGSCFSIDDFCTRAGFWQLSECVPEPVAGGGEHCQAGVALQEMPAGSDVVGECAAGQLGGLAGTVQELQGLDWVAVSTGGTGCGIAVGVDCAEVWGFRFS